MFWTISFRYVPLEWVRLSFFFLPSKISARCASQTREDLVHIEIVMLQFINLLSQSDYAYIILYILLRFRLWLLRLSLSLLPVLPAPYIVISMELAHAAGYFVCISVICIEHVNIINLRWSSLIRYVRQTNRGNRASNNETLFSNELQYLSRVERESTQNTRSEFGFWSQRNVLLWPTRNNGNLCVLCCHVRWCSRHRRRRLY